jgi:predicted amidohydrolase
MRLILVQPQLRHAPDADNLAAVRQSIESSGIVVRPGDLLVLPERVLPTQSHAEYLASVSGLASELGCSVVGGSHHEARGEALVNTGVAVDARGRLIGSYEKVRPYATEREWVEQGSSLGELVVEEKRVLVLICADFWFSDLFYRADVLPDLILVPALSVSRKPTPDYSRTLWRHLAVARAYEFGAFVGVSDWGHPSELPLLTSSGVGGFADPAEIDPAHLFKPIDPRGASAFELNFDRLAEFRHDRTDRGFFWRPPHP